MRRHGEMVMTRSDCLNCHHEPDRATAGENCSPCHSTQLSIYSGTALGAGMSDVMFESDLDCSGCHIDENGQITRSGPETCLNCHEEGYDEMLSQWQSSNAGIMEEIESLLARLETAKLKRVDKESLRAARTALDLFTRDGSNGAHNSLLTEEHLSEVLNNLKKLLPVS
jgi:hypothetical protein